MATSRHVMLLVVACTLAVLFIGSAEAGGYKKCNEGYKNCDHKKHHGHKDYCKTWVKGDVNNCGDCGKQCKTHVPNTIAKCEHYRCIYKCTPGYADCDHNKHNGCEKNIYSDVKNCGKCGYECKAAWKDGEAYCKNGQCFQRCKHSYKYDDKKKCCVKYH